MKKKTNKSSATNHIHPSNHDDATTPSSTNSTSSSALLPRPRALLLLSLSVGLLLLVMLITNGSSSSGGGGGGGVSGGNINTRDVNDDESKEIVKKRSPQMEEGRESGGERRGSFGDQSGNGEGGDNTDRKSLDSVEKAKAQNAGKILPPVSADEEGKARGQQFSGDTKGEKGGEVNVAGGGRAEGKGAVVVGGWDDPIPAQCSAADSVARDLLHFPLSPIEEELRRLAYLTHDVMKDINATYWPVDATLLGLMRSGRVATDRDLDYSIHATFGSCWKVLSSLKDAFVRRGAKVKFFKVAPVKAVIPEGYVAPSPSSSSSSSSDTYPHIVAGKKVKIARYAMVRIVREHGAFDTGPDFNCVYTDDPRGPSFFTHKGVLTVLPKGVLPLGKCLIYNRTIPCPGDGMALLNTLAPRYSGCMVYPHCLGDPRLSHKDCLTPHPRRPLSYFIEATRRIDQCGYTSLAQHYAAEAEGICRLGAFASPRCETDRDVCFVQPFKD